ncbi:MAG: hypothetical protein IKM31_01240 [Oscillospiraceae bacterium]|nr:hypothetical protein [Oscillospiraceae bacterium]
MKIAPKTLMGITSLILGVVSIVWACIDGSWPSMMLGVTGIILGIFSREEVEKIALAGIILSAVGAGIARARYFTWLVCTVLSFFGF